MTNYVLDASAVIRLLDREAGADRVHAIFADSDAGNARISISAVQWGEIAGNIRKRYGGEHEARVMRDMLPRNAGVLPVNAERALRAAHLKVDRGISYADAFALELAMESPDRVLVTADYDFKAVEDLARIEFLPAK
jgi:predicted nucleic acid-binding protein